MLRFICRETDVGAAIHVGGPVHVTHVTFTDAEKAELWLRGGRGTCRECVGVELVEPTPEKTKD